MNDFIDNEECFGFHSEYYLNPMWRFRDRYSRELDKEKGFMEFSEYRGEIYSLCPFASDAILKHNPYEKRTGIVFIRNEENYYYKYIAVNRQGYYLYDRSRISLFGFDGSKIYTYKFGPEKKVDCLYIYDDSVFYAETAATGIAIAINGIDMLQQEQYEIWKEECAEPVLERLFQLTYEMQRKTKLPYFQNPSNMNRVSCEFLYANQKRIVAGYTCSDTKMSYIVNVDAGEKLGQCFLEIYPVSDDARGSVRTLTEKHIISFHMLDDTMWVKSDGEETPLIHTQIEAIHVAQAENTTKWEVKALDCNSDYSCYFDGETAYKTDNYHLYRIDKNGIEWLADYHVYETAELWCFGEFFITERNYIKCGCLEEATDYQYYVNWQEIEKFIKKIRRQQLTSILKKKQETENAKAVVQKKEKESWNVLGMAEF